MVVYISCRQAVAGAIVAFVPGQTRGGQGAQDVVREGAAWPPPGIPEDLRLGPGRTAKRTATETTRPVLRRPLAS
jgi:hypothetical protein